MLTAPDRILAVVEFLFHTLLCNYYRYLSCTIITFKSTVSLRLSLENIH